MTTKLVNVRLPEQLYKEGAEVVATAGYANFQELLKDSLRQTIHEIKKEQALRHLQELFGSAAGKTRKAFSPSIKDAIAEELVKNLGKQQDSFKRAGL